MKNLLKSVFAAAMLLLMVACDGSKTNEAYPLPMKYLPVQLEGSKMWSILDLKSGDVVVKDVYKAMPSAVVNDMYFVMNDEGTFSGKPQGQAHQHHQRKVRGGEGVERQRG